MSQSESRALLPDWHQRPVRWKVENRTIEEAIQDRLDSRASLPTFGFQTGQSRKDWRRKWLNVLDVVRT